MNQYLYGLKREYWENKRLLFAMPIIVTALFFMMAIAANWTYEFERAELELDDKVVERVTPSEDQNSRELSAERSSEITEESSKSSGKDFWFSGVYLAAAWLAAIFYALSSLYSDRRDRSILFWKTMPVSEFQTVMTKYGFAVLAFPMVAMAVSLMSAAVLTAYGHVFLPAEMMAEDEVGLNLLQLVIWPVAAMLVVVFWSAPVFGLALIVSTYAKRMPLLWLIVPVIFIRILEGILFGTRYVFGFLNDHSPFSVLRKFDVSQPLNHILHYFFVEQFLSMALGLLIAIGLFWQASELRDKHFETH